MGEARAEQGRLCAAHGRAGIPRVPHPAGRWQSRVPKVPMNITQRFGLGAPSKAALPHQNLWPEEVLELQAGGGSCREGPGAVSHGSDGQLLLKRPLTWVISVLGALESIKDPWCNLSPRPSQD